MKTQLNKHIININNRQAVVYLPEYSTSMNPIKYKFIGIVKGSDGKFKAKFERTVDPFTIGNTYAEFSYLPSMIDRKICNI